MRARARAVRRHGPGETEASARAHRRTCRHTRTWRRRPRVLRHEQKCRAGKGKEQKRKGRSCCVCFLLPLCPRLRLQCRRGARERLSRCAAVRARASGAERCCTPQPTREGERRPRGFSFRLFVSFLSRAVLPRATPGCPAGPPRSGCAVEESAAGAPPEPDAKGEGPRRMW